MRLLIFAGCLSFGLWSASVFAVDDKQVQQAVEAAKKSFEKAVAEQGGWVSTKKLISSAELSATKGDKNKAMELANRAKREAELSYQQAVSQKKGWSEPAYLK
jgi:multidrug resistance efflux pump